MSPNSFISGSEPDRPRAYLLHSIALAAAILGCLAGLNIMVKFRTAGTEAGSLVAFQQRKLQSSQRIDTLLVGDSSLGDGVSARLFDRLTGHRSLNLALNGAFGYAGSYNMLRRAWRSHPEIRTVVFMHTADMMTREADFDGYVRSAPSPDLLSRDAHAKWEIVKAFVRELFDYHAVTDLLRMIRGEPPLKFAGDYVAQEGPLPSGADAAVLARDINPDKVYFLAASEEFCLAHNLRCLYAEGPLLDTKLSKSRPYLAAAHKIIRGTGMPIAVEEPFAVPPAMIGNSEAHIAPQFAPISTRYYAEKLGPWLQAAKAR